MAIIKTDKKFHIQSPDFEAGYNGQGPNPLYEPVPNFSSRPGDKVIQPEIDNNTIITNENNKISKINNPLEYINKINISEFLDIKNKANINGIYIYIFIIIALIVNIYLGLFITPFLLGGSALISFFIILLSALILFLLMYLFS